MGKKIHLIYFSPTGTTRKTLSSIAKGFEGYRVVHHDLTSSATPPNLLIKDGIAIFGLPVYAGRAQATALKRMRKIKGHKVPAVVVGLYGNREFEDAIVELRDVVTSAGFIPVAGGAFIGEHSYATKQHQIAMGRPDENDLLAAQEFGSAVMIKLESGDLSTPEMEGNVPYKELVLPKGITPKTDHEKCQLCGSCVKACPTSAINMSHRVTSNAVSCIMCMACAKVCKKDARAIYNANVLERKEALVKNCSEAKKPVIFI